MPDVEDGAGPLPSRPVSPHRIHGRGYVVLVPVLVLVVILSGLVAISVGASGLPLDVVWGVVLHHVVPAWGPRRVNVADDLIVWQFRAPRAVLALLARAGLSLAGAVLQALVRNPLADPYVLGVAQGASFGAVAVIVLGSASVGGLGLSGAAFAGAMVVMAAVFLLSRSGGRLMPARLVLAGVAIGYLCGAATSYLEFLTPDGQALQGVLFWLLGSVAGATWGSLPVPAITVAVCAVWLMIEARSLNALTLGDDMAAALGVDVSRLRLLLMVTTSVLTGAVVAVAGGIGFVGLMIPHIVRLLVGPDHRRLLPVSALLGAAYLEWVDIGARTLQAPTELPLGILTAAIGAPFFLWLMSRSRRVEGAA